MEAPGAPGPPPAPRSLEHDEEPRLRYCPLGADSPRAQGAALHSATRLRVSEKLLAVGHADGRVNLLDQLGNQVKSFREHSAEVTDLSFDEASEFLASTSTDGTVVVYGLYSEEVTRFKAGAAVTTVALDPRYGSRKTREFVYGTAAGSLALCSKGWLGSKETVLFRGKGAVRCARMAGTLLAWATDSGLRIYDTASHTRLGKVDRPASAAADAAAPCSLLWRGERELFAGWGRHVLVLRVAGAALAAAPGAATRPQPAPSLQIVASFDAGCCVLGVAPFGADLALLTWGLPGGDGGGAAVAAAEAQPGLQLGTLLSPGATSTAEEAATGVPPPAETAASPVAAGGGEQAAAGGEQQEQQQEAAPGGRPPQEQGQGQGDQMEALSLGFYSRDGQLLAADALGSACPAAERRWHQLALLYPGDADLKLAAAAPVPWMTHHAGVGGSGRSSPAKPASSAGHSPAKPRAPGGSTPASSQASPQRGVGVDGASAAQPGVPTAQQASEAGEAQQDVQQQQAAAAADGVQQQGRELGWQASVQEYKWWRDGEEPWYLMSGPEEVLVGRPRDGNDRVAWLLQRRRYADALAVAEEDYTVPAARKESVGEEYLQFLTAEGQWEEAARLCPRVLKTNALAWERWAFSFAQARQLAALAPVLPTHEPQLKQSIYDMVLSSMLLNPAEHGRLRAVVSSWPHGAYDAAALQAAVLSRMSHAAGGSWPDLQQVAAHLYTVQGRHEEALQLLVQMRSPSVFDYIARHALVGRLAPYAADFIDLDEVKATSLLVENSEEVPPDAVVAALQHSAGRAAEGEHRQRWRRRLHHYLDWLFHKDSQQGAEFAELQVELYAEFEPKRLLHFLMASPSYPLERAYQVCERRGLTREMVYVLGRMGSAERALRLIVEDLRDVVQAVEFVQLQRDDDLWEQLVALTLGDAQLTGELLDHAGGYIDPLRVVSQIPQHMQVENLRGRLVKIITDFRTQMCLQEGCNTILRHDCLVLANRLYRVLRSSLRRIHLRLPAAGGAKWVLYDAHTGEEAVEDDAAAALLGGSSAAPTAAAAASPRRAAAALPPRAALGGGTSPEQQQQQQQQKQQHGQTPTQQQRVWVGFLGGPPAAEQQQETGNGAQHEQQRQGPPPLRSPSKFAPSPLRSPSQPRRAMLVS
ncbi:vacuolar sorting-associated 41-like protein [Micractinium conductrix]|uniref:Vacuolar sorting-associated 41-like protein n=1 Tax=Micractinium conductrix TaxID=554055 RepID=A0A2P6VL60_9CHLO|nr:vacuolar sorting-associated 41-like protein [Micractinium conductrix]|eukprot:PSC74814.1 vacuolar sorting-associated 41-like protein [Micractinium conductrix]